jgi:hypothetical protein
VGASRHQPKRETDYDLRPPGHRGPAGFEWML